MKNFRLNLLLPLLVLAFLAWFFPLINANEQRINLLEESLSTALNRADRAQDWTAIANLQASYGYYVDKSRWDDAADLFSADATLEIAGRGLFKGQDRIREYLFNLGPLAYGRMYNHLQLQPVIHISADGESAKARWRSFMMVGGLGREARWGEATYENEYVKQDGVWLISKLHSYIGFYVEYEEGWHKGAVGLPTTFTDLPPDDAPTTVYGAYPTAFIPPYHYANPVSGRQFTQTSPSSDSTTK
jgi:hypothetical protein